MMHSCASQRRLAIGIGCRRGVSADAIEAAVRAALDSAAFAFAHIAVIASIDIKQDEAGLRVFCDRHDLPLRFFPAEEIARMPADGVCEPCALLASDGGELLVRKTIEGRVTVAIAMKKA
ncbi:Cobalamin (Vitamin B12) biosynthesis CbiG protein (fragment) [Burkholderia sp. 8Y]